MAPRTVQLRRDVIHVAVTAFIEVGVFVADIALLADLRAGELLCKSCWPGYGNERRS